MKKIFILFIAMLFSSCQNNQQDVSVPLTESIIILKNFKPVYKSIIDNNTYLQSTDAAIEIIDPKQILKIEKNLFNNVSDTIRVSHTSKLMLVNVKLSPLAETTYYVYPGDTVVTDFKDENNIKEKYKNNKECNYIEPFKIYDKDIYSMQFTSNGNGFKKRNILDSLNRIKDVKSLIKLYTDKLINKEYYKLRLAKINYSDELNKQPDSKFIHRDYHIGLSEYQHYLRRYAIKKFNIEFVHGRNSFYLNSRKGFDEVLKSNEFEKKAKDYLLFYFLNEMTQDFSYEDFSTRYSLFKKNSNDSCLVKYINDKYLLDYSDLKKESKNTFIINRKKYKKTLQELISENEGKVVYIDFWASWCAPCREEMPDSQKLREKYRGKDIVFLYISIDNDFEKWQKALAEEGLSDYENSFLAINYSKADFYKALKMKSIPRYLIYNKKGKLVLKNAPGPSNKMIEEELNKYLYN